MLRITRLFMTFLLAVGFALTGASGASAQPQSVGCTSRLLDATNSRNVDTAFVAQQLAKLKEIAPTVDVYLQAYQQLPGGDVDGFWQAARQQCPSWFDPSGDQLKSNVLVMAYGLESGSFAFGYGLTFTAVLSRYENEVQRTILTELVNSGDDNDYLTSGLAQVPMNVKFYMEFSPYFSEEDGKYHPPTQAVLPEPKALDEAGLGTVVGYTVLGMGGLVLVVLVLSLVIKRRH